MTYLLHRYTGALSKSLLALIGVILLVGQLTWQPAAPIPIAVAASTTVASAATATNPGIIAATTAANLSRQPARDADNTPDPHCHRKVYLLPDKRHDLKPVFFIPLPPFRLAALSVEHLTTTYFFPPGLAAGAVRPACLRGPPSI